MTARKSTARKPMAKKAAAKKPMAKKSVAKKPMAKPAASKPVAKVEGNQAPILPWRIGDVQMH